MSAKRPQAWEVVNTSVDKWPQACLWEVLYTSVDKRPQACLWEVFYTSVDMLHCQDITATSLSLWEALYTSVDKRPQASAFERFSILLLINGHKPQPLRDISMTWQRLDLGTSMTVYILLTAKLRLWRLDLYFTLILSQRFSVLLLINRSLLEVGNTSMINGKPATCLYFCWRPQACLVRVSLYFCDRESLLCLNQHCQDISLWPDLPQLLYDKRPQVLTWRFSILLLPWPKPHLYFKSGL